MDEKQPKERTAVFHAILPQTQSAIKIGADTMRIQLEISSVEIGQALPLLAFQNCLLEVTIRAIDS